MGYAPPPDQLWLRPKTPMGTVGLALDELKLGQALAGALTMPLTVV